MILVILGLALWAGVHFWKRVAPAHRAGFGDKGKGIVTAGSVLAIVLMVIGYRGWDGTFYWGRSAAMVGINNLLMVAAVYLFAASGAKTRVAQAVRHPQLLAVILWSVAHLLVNGDTPSFVLFGGLGIWALAEIVVLNRAGAAGPAHAVPRRKEVSALVATTVVFVVVALVHMWLGYSPFG